MKNKILYCIENQKEGLDYGKHNFVYVEGFGITCKFCFLPEEKANFKPIAKGTDGKFHFVEVESN